jgi:uncharacterized OB-fold protein
MADATGAGRAPTSYEKPVPVPDEASRPFFEGARHHQLMLQRCTACGRWLWPVKSRCPHCWSPDLTWAAASGRGSLYSFTVVHQVVHPAFAAAVPYIIAAIDLEEGVRIISNIVDCPHDELRIGMPLTVTFEEVSAAVTLPKFRPAARQGPAETGTERHEAWKAEETES